MESKPVALDTSIEAERIQIERWQRMTPEEKLELAELDQSAHCSNAPCATPGRETRDAGLKSRATDATDPTTGNQT